MRALSVSGRKAAVTEREEMPPAKKPQQKRPAAKKKPENKTMVKLLDDLQEVIKEQEAINKKITAINRRVRKADPSKDPSTAKKIEKATSKLNYLNDQAILFSAIAGGDPWEYVTRQIKLILDLENKPGDNSKQIEEIYEQLGHEEDFSKEDLDDWIQLGKFRSQGLMSYRQEQWVAVRQMRYQEMMYHLNIEEPYPGASPDAYW